MYGTGRKFFSLLLAWVLIFTLVPASAFAEAGSEVLITSNDGPPAIEVETDTDPTVGGQDPSQEQQQGGEPELGNEPASVQRMTDVEPQGFLWHTVTFDSQGGTAVEAQYVFISGTIQEPADPTKEGYTFAGWYKKRNLTDLWNFDSDTVTKNITLYAKWECVSIFTVTFNSNGGSTVDSKSVASGSAVTRPTDPTLEGFTFEGWYTESNTPWNFADPVNGDITLYAKWEAIPVPTFTVMFNSNGGSAVASASVPNGSTVTKPTDPTRDGFTFEGWYTENNTPWNFTDPVNGNITLYAKWEPIPTYTVTFNSNGGSDVASITGLTGGAKITKPGNPALDGHTFEGWFKTENLTGQWDFDTDTVTQNITLYAKWKVNPCTFTVTFDSKGGSEVGRQFVPIGDKVQKPADPTLDGCTFEGWYYKAYGLEFAWNFGSYRVWQNVTLYAKWKPAPVSTYTVTFNSNGGSAVGSISVPSGSKITKPTDPTTTGCTFAGWYKNTELTNAWDFEANIVTENITLYAKWNAIRTFAVTFNSNGGSTVDSISVPSGSKITKPTDPTKTGCTFAGWYKNTELTNAWDFEANTVTENITLYAKWNAIHTFAVTFNSNGGSTVDSISVPSGSKITKPANPTKAGYSFGGWYKDSALTNAWDFENDKVTENITLYAKWNAIRTFAVTFNSNGGSPVGSISVPSGSKITKPADPWKCGYSFGGWYKESALTNTWDFENGTVTQDITLFAKWQAIPTFTVTFNSNGGSAVGSISVPSGSKISRPADPWKCGYSFGGWYKDSALTIPWEFNNHTINGNTTLYARWYCTYIPSYGWNDYIYPYPIVIPKTGGMVSLLPYALLSASALCAVLVTKRKKDL